MAISPSPGWFVCVCFCLFTNWAQTRKLGKLVQCSNQLGQISADIIEIRHKKSKQSPNTFAGIGTEFDIHNPLNSFLKYYILECSGMLCSSYWSWAPTNILFTQSGTIWRAPNRSFSEHRNESTFVYLFEKTAPHPRLSNLWNTPGKRFKIEIKVAEVSQL